MAVSQNQADKLRRELRELEDLLRYLQPERRVRVQRLISDLRQQLTQDQSPGSRDEAQPRNGRAQFPDN